MNSVSSASGITDMFSQLDTSYIIANDFEISFGSRGGAAPNRPFDKAEGKKTRYFVTFIL